MLTSSSVRRHTCTRQESGLSEEVRDPLTIPRKLEAFREGKGNPEEEEEEERNYRSCPRWRRPNFTPQESNRPEDLAPRRASSSPPLLSSPLLSQSLPSAESIECSTNSLNHKESLPRREARSFRCRASAIKETRCRFPFPRNIWRVYLTQMANCHVTGFYGRLL